MIKKVVIYTLAFLFLYAGQAQSQAKRDETGFFQKMGVEGVYLHYNNNLLFTGEYLHFKVYALNGEEKSFSNASKIAYVELLDRNGNRKLIQKIKLTNGTGNGEFFLPTDLNSDYYTLTAYTRYMLNWPAETFFHDKLVIINPYTNDQKNFRASQTPDIMTNTTQVQEESTKRPTSQKTDLNPDYHGKNSNLHLQLDKTEYTTRDKVALTIDMSAEHFGAYSLSVNRVGKTLKTKDRSSPSAYLNKFLGLHNSYPEELRFLPELRGELISGKLSSDQHPQGLGNRKILFSIPGDKYVIAATQTDENGDFIFPLDTENFNSRAQFHLLDDTGDNTTLTIARNPVPQLSIAYGNDFILEPEMKTEIEQRSIHNQIENAYFELKPDTVMVSSNFTPIYGKPTVTYHLDDYTRFSSFKETLVEIIDNAWITTDKDGNEMIMIRDLSFTNPNIGYSPLVIADGIIIQNHRDLIGFGANKIKTIRLTRNQFHLGGQIYQGIFDVETFDGDFNAGLTTSTILTADVLRPAPFKKQFKQTYEEENDRSKIPDFRHQLLWEPGLNLDSKKTTLRFFTSDIKGQFEIILEGFTRDLQPVKIKKILTVE